MCGLLSSITRGDTPLPASICKVMNATSYVRVACLFSLRLMGGLLMMLAMLWIGDVNSAWSADTASKPLDAEFLRGFLAGEYDVIGRKPDSLTTYTGRVTIREVGGNLEVMRVIDGKTERGTIQFDTTAGADRIPVLRAHFSMGGQEYEATYLWRSDLDNYPRLTGYIYLPKNQTKSPGLEALFPIHH
jgi:hypothetical protein